MFAFQELEEVTSGREQRRNRVWFVLIGGACLLGLFFLLHLFSMTVLRMTFFGYGVTVLTYGDTLYVRRRDKLGERWLWKSVLATIPLHVFLLGCVEFLVRWLPQFARTGFSAIGFIALCFAVESVLFDPIVDRFDPSVATQAVPSS